MSETLTKQDYENLRTLDRQSELIEKLKEARILQENEIEELKKEISKRGSNYNYALTRIETLQTALENEKEENERLQKEIEEAEDLFNEAVSDYISEDDRKLLLGCKLDLTCASLYKQGVLTISLTELKKQIPDLVEIMSQQKGETKGMRTTNFTLAQIDINNFKITRNHA